MTVFCIFFSEKDDKFEEKKSSRFASMGLFATSLHYWKLYETVKSAYTNYKVKLIDSVNWENNSPEYEL